VTCALCWQQRAGHALELPEKIEGGGNKRQDHACDCSYRQNTPQSLPAERLHQDDLRFVREAF
jgi:hypothetical protein